MKKKNIGSTLDSLFDELGEREGVDPAASAGGGGIEEPNAIVVSYEVLRRRVEPVGLVYLWPTTR